MSFLGAASSVLGGGRDTRAILSGADTGPVNVSLGSPFSGSSRGNPWTGPLVVGGVVLIAALYLIKK